jgi:hypothetical protein
MLGGAEEKRGAGGGTRIDARRHADEEAMEEEGMSVE